MIYSLIINFKRKGLIAICLLTFYAVNGQNSFVRYLDSADYHIDISSTKALQFLDSIPEPIEDNLQGRLADYYAIKTLIHDDFNEPAKAYQSNILALKYAELEENYEVAGSACLDIFSNLYFNKGDASAYIYLDKAKEFYKKGNYKNGLIEVEQIKQYAKFLDGEFVACNDLILKNLDTYKNIKDDAYYYMFALYMLTSNYIYLDDFENAHGYYTKFKNLQANPTIVTFNYKSFESAINVCFADVFFENKQIDSTFYYLSKASKYTETMGDDTLESYYKIYSDVYSSIDNVETSKIYQDSLKIFKEKMFKNVVDTSLELNNTLLKTESELKNVSKSKFYFGVFGVVLIVVLIIVSVIYLLFYRKQKLKLNHLNTQVDSVSYLKSSNEKLTVKVQSLEDYISSLKYQVKTIATIHDDVLLREKIKEFYKHLHLSSSTLLDESKNHFELVNDFNIDFFKKLKDSYSKLNESDIILCYYIFIGFKNKEIAVFLNTTVRAIESKRYRITKKINLDKEKTTLIEFLKETFEY